MIFSSQTITKHIKLLSLLLLPLIGISQASLNKPPVDSSILGKWPVLAERVVLSADGNYAAYTIEKQPKNSRTLIVADINKTSKQEFPHVNSNDSYFFSSDNKYLIFKKSDSLCLLELKSGSITYINEVDSYKFPRFNIGNWFAYYLKNSSNELCLKNLLTGKMIKFSEVVDYSFENNGKYLIIKISKNDNNGSELILELFDLLNEDLINVWSARNLKTNAVMVSYNSFDREGDQLAFLVKENSGNSIWYFQRGMTRSVKKVDNNTSGVDSCLITNATPNFSNSGQWIFFTLENKNDSLKTLDKGQGEVKVDIWSYRDAIVQPKQLLMTSSSQSILASIPVSGSVVTKLQRSENDKVLSFSLNTPHTSSDFVIISENEFIPFWWPHGVKPMYWIQSLRNSERKAIGANANGTFSPGGKFYVYWDKKQSAFISYDIEKNKFINITKKVPTPFLKTNITQVDPEPVSRNIAGWYMGDTALLVYDEFDIWQLDPEGEKPAVNITNGLGKKSRIRMRFLDVNNEGNKAIVYSGKESMVLSGFDEGTKRSGFFKKDLGKKGDPVLLSMGPYSFKVVANSLNRSDNISDCWILKRESAKEAPNYYFTKNFKSFTALSDIQPQQEINWLTTELITWKMLDGRMGQGVLYKPENFDPNKKYPVIFNYYEAYSHRMYKFLYPAYSTTEINIPWFVSHGYLVFTPDIYYEVAAKTGKVVGEYVYNSVVSAAKHLSNLGFVDGKRIALQGHSFGGFETAYLVTHSNLFAAACEAAGFTDPISTYLTLYLESPNSQFETIDQQVHIERGHQMYGATPWERPELYRKNSPVLNADKAITPLLIMHNKGDNQVQWRQGLELYMAFRRLGKQCWMLQYEQGAHFVFGKDAIDYTIRMQQFFDHYLKNAPAPIWMSQGIPAKLKGIQTGYAYDPSGSCGPTCKICKSWNTKYTQSSSTTLLEIQTKKNKNTGNESSQEISLTIDSGSSKRKFVIPLPQIIH